MILINSKNKQQGSTSQGKLNNVKERFLKPSVEVEQKKENELNLKLFKIIKTVGQGDFSQIYKVNLSTVPGKFFALKEIDKKQIKQHKLKHQVQNEVDILYTIKHKHIIELETHFEDDFKIYLLMEYAPKGSLYQKLQKEGRLQENKVKQYLQEILQALLYLHSMGILHRDIKPENILFGETNEIKLVDFGWSNYSAAGKIRLTTCGSSEYMSPEMIRKFGHSDKYDVWCVGILIYELMVGKTPFLPKDGDSIKQLQENILSEDVIFPAEVPMLARDFISQCLIKNQKERKSVQELLQHPWICSDQSIIQQQQQKYQKMNSSNNIQWDSAQYIQNSDEKNKNLQKNENSMNQSKKQQKIEDKSDVNSNDQSILLLNSRQSLEQNQQQQPQIQQKQPDGAPVFLYEKIRESQRQKNNINNNNSSFDQFMVENSVSTNSSFFVENSYNNVNKSQIIQDINKNKSQQDLTLKNKKIEKMTESVVLISSEKTEQTKLDQKQQQQNAPIFMTDQRKVNSTQKKQLEQKQLLDSLFKQENSSGMNSSRYKQQSQQQQQQQITEKNKQLEEEQQQKIKLQLEEEQQKQQEKTQIQYQKIHNLEEFLEYQKRQKNIENISLEQNKTEEEEQSEQIDDFGTLEEYEEKMQLLKIREDFPTLKKYLNQNAIGDFLDILGENKDKLLLNLDTKQHEKVELQNENEMLRQQYYTYKDYNEQDLFQEIPELLDFPNSLKEKLKENVINKKQQKEFQLSVIGNLNLKNRYLKEKIQVKLQKLEDIKDDLVQKERKQLFQDSEFQDLMQLFEEHEREKNKKEIKNQQLTELLQEVNELQLREKELELVKIEKQQTVEQKRMRKEIFQPERMTQEDMTKLYDSVKHIEQLSMMHQNHFETFEELEKQLLSTENQQYQQKHDNPSHFRPSTTIGYEHQQMVQNECNKERERIEKEYQQRREEVEKKYLFEKQILQDAILKLENQGSGNNFNNNSGSSKINLQNKIEQQQKLIQEQEKYFEDRGRRFNYISQAVNTKGQELQNMRDRLMKLDLQYREIKKNKYKK